MLKRFRLRFSLMLTALLVSSLLLTNAVKACEEPPQTLLALYMNSEVIGVARFDSESAPKKSNEDEWGYNLDTERRLVFTKIYKGPQDLKTLSFAYSDYVPNPNRRDAEPTEEMHIEDEHFFNLSKIKLGNEYLFFMTKNKETGEYYVTDYVSGVKETGKHLALYEKNLSALEQIAAAGENQTARLTEWIVGNLENPATREDAISDLAESFYNLSYQEEDPQFKGKGPFVVNEEGYGVYTVGVAKNLSAAQKDRIAAALYPTLQEAWFAPKPQYPSYGLAAILGGINKSRLALYSYTSMQSVAKGDLERRRIIGEFLTEAVADEEFTKMHFEIADLESQIEEAKKIKTPQGRKQLRDLNLSRDAKLREFDRQFKLLLGRNFVTVETKGA